MAPRVNNHILFRTFMQFVNVSGGLVGGSDPPAFQRAEKERMDKVAREEKEGGLNHNEQLYVSFGAPLFKYCSLVFFFPIQGTCMRACSISLW